jgi:hypothetical protein
MTVRTVSCIRWRGNTGIIDEGYAEEELVAELGSAFLCADLELALTPREDHASYIAHWLTVLKNDKRAIFRTAAHAQRAADFLHRLQPGGQKKAAYLPPHLPTAQDPPEQRQLIESLLLAAILVLTKNKICICEPSPALITLAHAS